MPSTKHNGKLMTDKYSLEGVPGVDPDSTTGPASILISGDTMTGKQNLAYRLLASGANNEESTVVISPDNPASIVYKNLKETLTSTTDLNRNNFGIIDCTGNNSNVDSIPGSVQFTESAGDLTGIGIELSKKLEQAKEANDNVRVALLSISPLIMYSDVETAYRFLHVLTSRIQAIGALGVFVLDSSAHEPQTLNLLTSLFDIEIKMSDDASDASVSGL